MALCASVKNCFARQSLRYHQSVLLVGSTSQQIRSTSSSTPSSLSSKKRQRFSCLDLTRSDLSIVERLCLEECLLRHDPQNRQWMIWGTHGHPLNSSKYLSLPEEKKPSYLENNEKDSKDSTSHNNKCMVVMGIGGKPPLLLDIPRVKDHQVWVIKRFSGGGTVVVDDNCLYTTIIGRNDQLTHVPQYPREIMAWTATDVFGPTFQRLKQTAQKKANNDTLQFPDFELRENDYVLGGTQKVAGNAQAIVKTGFLHHTTFLWTYESENMKYLTLPDKRPEYRKDRSHSSFLIKLQDAYHNQLDRQDFFTSLETVCHENFETEQVSLEDALEVMSSAVAGNDGGSSRPNGMQAFFDTKCRTRLIDLP